jgi:hypothetical protein
MGVAINVRVRAPSSWKTYRQLDEVSSRWMAARTAREARRAVKSGGGGHMKLGWPKRRQVPRPTSAMGLRLFADVREDKDLIARIGPHKDGASAGAVLDAAFQRILRMRFGSSPDIQAVRGLARAVHVFLENKVSPEETEAIIREGLGERIDVSHIGLRPTMLVKLAAFVGSAKYDLQMSDDQLYDLLVEAERAAEKELGYRPQQAVV